MAGIYIHIPFCRTICHYCDFYRVAAAFDETQYINAIIRELELRAEYLNGESVGTIYFGGGTPSLLNPASLNDLIRQINQHFTLDNRCEITLEANPDDLTDSYLQSVRETTPVNRLSIGVQSFIDRDLILMHRRHTAVEALQSIERARHHGFSNISADLIYGIPGSNLTDLVYNLDHLFALDVQHLSAYHLTIEPKTVLYKKAEKGLIHPVEEEESLAQYRALADRSASNGFIHYEVSNWAKEGFLSMHNTNYWKGVPYLGLGPSAHSYDILSRQWNVADLRGYLQGISEEKPVLEREELTPAMRLNELLMTSLRTRWGIDMNKIESDFGVAVSRKLSGQCEKYIRSGHMKAEGTIYTLTEEGFFISDAIVREMMVDENSDK